MWKKLQTSLQDQFDQPRLGPKFIPFLIFGVALVAVGLLTFNLGFFQDDWHHVYYYSHAGFEGLRQFVLSDSRPFAFIVYDPLFSLLGIQPMGWHIAVFLFRTFTVLAFWGILNNIWPAYWKENALISLLFLVYPVYLLQPLSVSLALHWSMFLVYMLSVLVMLLAVRQTKYFLPLTALAVLLEVFHLAMIEYYFGLELLRPVLLWLILREEPGRARLKRTFITWIPYLLVDLLYVLYRNYLPQLLGYERFSITFFKLLSQPVAFITFYLKAVFQDFTQILISTWHDAFNPTLFDFSSRSSVLIWIFVLLAALALWACFRLIRAEEHDAEGENRWAREMIGVGLLALLFGLLPGWVIGRTVVGEGQLWNGRFAMAAMFGAGMTWVGVIYLLVPKPVHRYLLLGILLSLAIGANLQTQVSYKASWKKQLNFYWQLFWRAPYIEPHTLLVSDQEFLFYMGPFPATFAVNTMYPQSVPFPQTNYWVVPGADWLDSDAFRSGGPVSLSAHASNFEGTSADSVTITFQPEDGQCLWVLSPQYGNYPFLSSGTLETLPHSSLNLIHSAVPGGTSPLPPADVFGPEPAPTWCYYFEKADLAAQVSDWGQVIQLWNEAQKKGFGPGHGVELFPFIRAYAAQGQWDQAASLAILSSKISERMPGAVCNLWVRLKADTADSDSRREALQKMEERFQCGL